MAGPDVATDPFLKPVGGTITSATIAPTQTTVSAAPAIALEPLVNPVELTQHFDVPATPDVVFALFQDPERVIACLPGARLTAPSDGKTIAADLSIKLGPISATFAGTGAISSNPATRSGVIEGQGVDGKSSTRVRAQLSYRLTGNAEGTTTHVTADVAYVLQGPLAQISRGSIARDFAGRMTETFAANLAASLAGTPPIEPKPLDAGSLLFALLKGWFGRLFGPK